MQTGKGKQKLGFWVVFIFIVVLFLLSVWKTNEYNNTKHHEIFSGASLFSSKDEKIQDVSVTAVPRGSTWTKAFDIRNEGITEHNF